MRTERGLPGDLALVLHWDKSDRVVTAFLHGCDEDEASKIGKWLNKAKAATKDPFLMTLVLAEIQLERHGKIYRAYHEEYRTLFDSIRETSEKMQTGKASSGYSESSESSESSEGSGGLEVAEKLANIFLYYQKYRSFQHFVKSFRKILDSLIDISNENLGSSEEFNITGRLREISHSYEGLIDQLSNMAEGLNLLLTTVSLNSQRYE